MAAIKRDAERRRRVRILFAGFAPTPSPAMLNAGVTALLRSRRPDREWHAGELVAALQTARR